MFFPGCAEDQGQQLAGGPSPAWEDLRALRAAGILLPWCLKRSFRSLCFPKVFRTAACVSARGAARLQYPRIPFPAALDGTRGTAVPRAGAPRGRGCFKGRAEPVPPGP